MSASAPDHPYATQLAMRARIERAVASEPLAFVDLGTSKIAVIIAESAALGAKESGGALRVLGVGAVASAGIVEGAPNDVDAAAEALSRALGQAAAAAGRRPRVGLAAFAGMAPRSALASAEIDLPEGAVRPEDVARVVAAAKPTEEGEERLRLHGVALRWRIDGAAALGDPVGRIGRKLAVAMLAVGADRAPLQQAARILKAAELEMIGAVAAPYAAALAAATPEERALGVAVADIGATTTSIAVFDQGRLASVACAPLGAGALTAQIARGFGVSEADAELLKRSAGSADGATPDGAVRLERPDGPPLILRRAALIAAIRPRALEILKAVRDQAAEAGHFGSSARPIALTGGGAELDGIAMAAEEVFGPRVRIARPTEKGADPLDVCSPGGWAAAVGLARYAAGAPEPRFAAPASGPAKGVGFWRWLRESW